jgi:hypothetical protein
MCISTVTEALRFLWMGMVSTAHRCLQLRTMSKL